MSTEKSLTDFVPTPNQQAFLTYMLDCDYNSSIVDACKAVGIARQSYYDWMENADFRAWWDDKLERHFSVQKHRVLSALYASALKEYRGGKEPDPKPDAALMRLAIERFDEKFKPGRKIEHSGGVEHSGVVRFEWAAEGEVDPDAVEPDTAGGGG